MTSNKVEAKVAKEKRGAIKTSGSSESNKAKGGAGEGELSGVHIISDQDLEGHFGKIDSIPLGAANDETKPAANQNELSVVLNSRSQAAGAKIPVNLQIVENIWQQALEDAEKNGLEISTYVEMALDRFRDTEASGRKK